MKKAHKAGLLTKELADGCYVFWIDINKVFVRRTQKTILALCCIFIMSFISVDCTFPQGKDKWANKMMDPDIDEFTGKLSKIYFLHIAAQPDLPVLTALVMR